MLPGPTLIVKAPGCNTPVKISTLASGNTFGAVYWTDGKREAPMLPDQSWLRKHPQEGVLFWAGEWEVVDTIPFDGSEDVGVGRGIPYAEDPSEGDYFTALQSGIADSDEKLRYVRIRLWWAGNDAIREQSLATLTPSHIDNLARLALLWSETDPQQRLMKAEGFRELGFFDDAQKLLGLEFPAGLQAFASFIDSLCRAKDSRVTRFPA